MMVGERKCPICGVEGRRWRTDPDVFVCPICSTFYHEFGIVFLKNDRFT